MGDMNVESKLKISSSLTPYDVSVLILVYFYCYHNVPICGEIFVNLITPSMPSKEINPILEKEIRAGSVQKPLLPLLEPLLLYLVSVDEKNLAIKLVSFLESMDSLDVVTQLLRTLESECLVKNYRYMKNISSPKSRKFKCKRITQTSFVGIYLRRCLTKYQIGDFEDRETLWECLTDYLRAFKKSALWVDMKSSVQQIRFDFMPNSTSTENDREMISYFQQFAQQRCAANSNVIMIGHTHFQSLLNWEIYNVSQNNSRIEPITQNILDELSLNDMAHFPAVHVLRYLKAVSTNCYQAASDALHNYFDYMLTQNDENCFHISLLCLATFHTCLDDCPAAIKAFEEATKVARENKDTATLNLIMIWVVGFIEEYPEYSNHFQVTVEQIVRYLKSCTDNESPLVFENAYKFESLLLMRDNSSSVLVLESAFKYMVIALQRSQSGSGANSVFRHLANIWENLGYTSLSQVYRDLSEKHIEKIEQEIECAFAALENRDFSVVTRALLKLNSPRLKYEQCKRLKLLEIKYCIAIEDYQKAMKKLSERAQEFGSTITDAKWKFNFEMEKCKVLLSCGVGIRSLHILMDMINGSISSNNPLQAAESLLLLCEILNSIGKPEQCYSLLESNLSVALQFHQLERRVLSIMKAGSSVDK